LYGKYRGTLLIAIAQDGRNNIIPIAYALVEGETADAWFFFLQRLRTLVASYPGLCLISDRHESIKSVVRRLNTDWHHVFCIRHISQNFMRTFKNADMKNIVTNMG
jgi:transposase-like protein